MATPGAVVVDILVGGVGGAERPRLGVGESGVMLRDSVWRLIQRNRVRCYLLP